MSLAFRCSSCAGVNRVDPARLDRAPACGRCKAPLDLTGHPAQLSDDELAALVAQAPVPVLVDFWAPWCGPCRSVAPQLEAVARKRAGQVLVVKVNTDEHPRTAGALGIRGIPAFAVYVGGRVVQQASGAMGADRLEQLVAPHVG